MILTTAANIAGHRIVKTVRLVPATRSAPVMGRDIIAVSRLWWEAKSPPTIMHDARAEAVHRLAADAEKRAANALSDICFTTSAIMTGASDILSYGTAVVVEPE